MGNRITRWIDRAFWGKSDVQCQECGITVAAGDAVWRGARPYCSIEHEAADAEDASFAAPGESEWSVPAREPAFT